MHVQVVTYGIADITDAEFIEANLEFAAMMAQVPGLLAKIWLDEPDSDVRGGVYLWQDRAACESFLASDLWASAVTDETITDLESRDYVVMPELTELTQPGLTVL